jgi:D-threo-aldose 1-dehydrogenase
VKALGRGGLEVGAFSFGGAPLGNMPAPIADADWQGALAAAWDAGVRFFDTAPHYGLGLSEERYGVGLAGHDRDEYIVSTKVGRLLAPNPGLTAMDDEGFAVPATLVRVRDYSRDGVLRSLESSLERLGLSRIDILLVHDPDDYFEAALNGAFPALDDLRRQGVIRSYGAGMNQSAMLSRFVRETDLDVVLLAGRYTLFEQNALDDLLPLCVARDVSVIAGGAFNSGLLATDHPNESVTYNYAPAPPQVLARARELAGVCARHGVSLPAAAVQFVLAHPSIKTVCLGMRTAAEVQRNATLFDATIPSTFWSDLQESGLLRLDAPVPSGRKR